MQMAISTCPTYDSAFSTYALNSFTKGDHVRLANYLASTCKGKFMLVIKATDFVRQLYNSPSFNIGSFELNYGVSFMDRNGKSVV